MKWRFKIIWGWDFHKDFIDINILTFHKEENVIWLEIVGIVLMWELEEV